MSEFRSRFSQGGDCYLLSHSIGLAPATLADAISSQYLSVWQQNPQEAWPQWLQQIERFRGELGRLFTTHARNFCPQSNVSAGATKILYALPRRPARSTILIAEQAFPSLGYVFQMAKDAGYSIKYLPKRANALDPNVWADHITDDVGLVVITHVHSNTGELIPVAEVAAVARQREVWSIVDTAQSNGVIPIQLDDWPVDFVVGSCVKWLCGGPGAGFLWASDKMLQMVKPIDVGWFSHADPFEFDIHQFRYADDALKFWGGTPAVVPYVAAAHAIQILLDIGIDAIREHNLMLTDRLREGVDDTMLMSPANHSQRSGTVVVRLDHSNREAQLDRLESAQIRFDEREAGIRLSPHIYTTTDDVDQVIRALRS